MAETLRAVAGALHDLFFVATSPKGVAGTERLDEYWTTGKGAAEIRWAEPCAFCRCLDKVGTAAKGKLSPARLKGHCANLEKRATGHWPNPEHSRTHHCPC
jgi:hypothetical protein